MIEHFTMFYISVSFRRTQVMNETKFLEPAGLRGNSHPRLPTQAASKVAQHRGPSDNSLSFLHYCRAGFGRLRGLVL